MRWSRSRVEELKPKALRLVQESPLPISIGDVARHLQCSWSTARQILMELVIEGKVTAEKTTKSFIFRARSEEGG